jgi:hypothetical protein
MLQIAIACKNRDLLLLLMLLGSSEEPADLVSLLLVRMLLPISRMLIMPTMFDSDGSIFFVLWNYEELESSFFPQYSAVLHQKKELATLCSVSSVNFALNCN